LLDVVAGAPAFEAVGYVFYGAGIGVAGGAYLDGGGSGHHELGGVFGCEDAAHAYDGDANGLGDVVDHADGDGLDGGAGEASGDVGDTGAAGFHVDGEGDEGVDERDDVGTGVGGDTGHLADAGDVGGELDHEGAMGCALGAGDELVEERGVCAEDHAAVAGVGAAGIELVHGDAGGVVEGADNFEAVFDGEAEDVGDDDDVLHALELWKLFGDEGTDAHVLEADGVDHASGGLDDARRGIAGHGLAGEALGDEGSDVIERDNVFEFDAVAKGSAGGDDGRAQLYACHVHVHVGTFDFGRVGHSAACLPWMG